MKRRSELKDLLIFRQPQATNFILSREEAQAIAALMAPDDRPHIPPIPSELVESILPKGAPVPPPPGSDIAEQDLRMLPELLFRLVARLRERPEMLQSLDATAFWAAVRKVQPSASTIDDLRSVNDQLRDAPAPGALWTAWMLNTRATELKALLLQH